MGAAGVLASRLGGAAANVAAVLVLGLALPPGEVGIVLTALAAAVLAELGAALGREEVAVQAVPQALAAGDQGRASAYLRSALRQVALLSPLAGAAGAGAVALTTDASPLALVLTALIVPPMAALRVLCRTGQAAGAVTRGAFCLLGLRPGLFALGVAGLWAAGALTVEGVLAAAFAAALLSVLAQLVSSAEALGFVRARPSTPDPAWRRAGLSLLVTLPMLGEFTSTVTLIAGTVLAEGEVAILGVALRYTGLVWLGTSVMISVLGPRLSREWTRERDEAARLARLITAVSVPASVLAVAGVWAAAGPLMGVFGEAYAAGAWPLRVLVLMPLAGALSGPCLLVLTAAGRAREGARAAMWGLAGVTLGVVVGAGAGLVGVALGATLGFTLWQGGLATRLWRRERLWVGAGRLGARRAHGRP